MGPDEADEDSAYREFYHHDQSVIIASDIENIVLVAHVICRWKVLAYLRQIVPLGMLGDVIPSFQRYSRISVSGLFIEFFDFSM